MLEVILGIAGVWTLFSGKVPSWIVGKKDFEITGIKARIIGGILALPLPLSFVTSVFLAFLFGEDGLNYALVAEVAIFLVVLLVVMFLVRKFRLPVLQSASQQSSETGQNNK